MLAYLSGHIDVISLVVLILAIIISIWKKVNLGIMALGLALIIGYFIGGMSIDDLIKGFPTGLLLMLVGVTFLFGIAQSNGTLEKITMYTVKSVKGKVALLPIVLFFLAFILSSLGPGQISISALLAPSVMILATETGISPLLMALVVGNGAQAGAMSPLSPNGIIGNSVLKAMGITGMGMTIWMQMLIVHVIVAAIAYFVCGGLKIWKVKNNNQAKIFAAKPIEPFNYQQISTLCAIGILIISVLVFKIDIGFMSFLLGSILILMKAGNEKAAFRSMPWGAILLVTGVSVLVALMKNVGGMNLFAQIMSNLSNPFTATLVVGFVTGLVSAYASTSGVILPAFLPLAPLLVTQIGAPASLLPALISTIVVAGHLTDMSPLSTTGAVFISAAPDNIDREPLFKGMMIWGFAMSVVGAIICWLLFTVL